MMKVLDVFAALLYLVCWPVVFLSMLGMLISLAFFACAALDIIFKIMIVAVVLGVLATVQLMGAKVAGRC